jgi:tripartite ATP-independent transporter DctP family solute receptor
MKKCFFGLMSVLVLCGLVMTSCAKKEGGSGTSSGGAPIVMRIGNVTAPDHILNVTFEELAAAINERSGGRIQATVYPSGQLGTLRTMTEGLQLGTLEMATQSPGGLASFWPMMGVLELPYMFKSNQEVYDVIDGPIGQELNQKFLEKNNVRILGYWMNLVRETTNNKRPVKTPDDLKGIKLRVPETKTIADAFKALGASPVTMAVGELYTALAQGTVDGQENPSSIIFASKYYEVQKYLSLTNHVFSPVVVMVSEDFWKKLPDDLRKIVEEEFINARARSRPISEKMDDDITERLREYMEVNAVDIAPFRDLVQPVYDELINTAGAEARTYINRIEADLKR